MKKENRLILGAAALSLFLVYPFHSARAQETDCDDEILKTTLTALGGSGVTGTAILCIGEDGVRAQIKAENVNAGHLFTVWILYNDTPSGPTIGPGRLDSALSKQDKVRFHGRVGGLAASSGSAITLLVFDHGTPSSNNAVRASRVLTPMGGTPVARAVFDIP